MTHKHSIETEAQANTPVPKGSKDPPDHQRRDTPPPKDGEPDKKEEAESLQPCQDSLRGARVSEIDHAVILTAGAKVPPESVPPRDSTRVGLKKGMSPDDTPISCVTATPSGRGQPSSTERVAAELLAQLLKLTKRTLPPVLVPPTGRVQDTSLVAKHTEGGPEKRSLSTLWAREGEGEPQFTYPSTLTDLQIWHRGELHTLQGEPASRRLSVLAPTVFCEEVGDRRGAVAQAYLGKRMGFRITGSSLARSYAGAKGFVPRDVKKVADSMLKPQWQARGVTGKEKNTRFFDCVTSVFAYFKLLERRYQNEWYASLGCLLVKDMLRHGRCRTALTTTYLDSLEVVLHGKQAVQHHFHEALLSLSKEERGVLWKTRRLFAKDDNDPILNATQAMERMTVPRMRSDEMERQAHEVMNNFERRAAAYVAQNFEGLKARHDNASLHRSAATTFFTRGLGGGAAEMHLTVGLYRLSQGKASPLQDVWGNTPEDLSLDSLFLTMGAQSEFRKEIEAACTWMLHELERRQISYPYLCIFPAREVKSRCFMLLPYALQQGGYQAATTVGQYLRSRESTSEVFRGFDDTDWLRRLRKDVEEGATHLLSLDSQVSTDPLPHALCRRVFAPFYPVFSAYTRQAVEKTFGPTRVHVAHRRPRDFLRALTFSETVLSGLNVSVREVCPKPSKDTVVSFPRIRAHPNDVPTHLRTYAQAKPVAEALKTYGRVILKAPTGSGKTVLVSTLFNAIVQFPSVAALELMSEYLTSIGKRHNVHHSRCKTDPMEWDEGAGEPLTILCTSYYVRGLNAQFPGMVIALDEAESKQENYVINLEFTRHKKCKTLLMSATPDELRGEEYTARVELAGGTNYPVERLTCTYAEMIELICDPETPPSLVCAHSEPLCEKLAATVKNAGRQSFALTARMRALGGYLEKVRSADVILGTNAIRSSVTLPDLEFVFDLGRLYESIDFPLSGLESLVLTQVSEAMGIQCAGRVGRTKPGRYYIVEDPPGHAIPYSPDFLARVPTISRDMERITPERYSRGLNHGSILVERYSQKLMRLAGVKAEPFCPLWASAVRQLAPHQSPQLLASVAFEALGIVNRTRQVARDLDMKDHYDEFVTEAVIDYHVAARRLLRRLQENSWFPSELAQITRWTKDLSQSEGALDSVDNQRACALALWRQVAEVQGALLVGRYRNFNCALPPGASVGDSGVVLVLGLSLHNNAVTARWTLPLHQEVCDWLASLMAQVGEVEVVEGVLGATVPAVLGWDVKLQNKGRQTRRLDLSYDRYTHSHVFQPQDLERIWNSMERVLADARHSKDAVTTQGSPMSATASFTVLNSFGIAAHDAVRDGIFGGVKAPLHGGGIFGDDDVRCAGEEALRVGTAARESLGLETKWSATGTARIASDGKLVGNSDQLGLFTERLIDLDNLTVIPSVKPAGLIRLFQSENPTALPLSTQTYRNDMVSYEHQLRRTDARWAGTILQRENTSKVYARRETAPRRILSRLLKRRVNPHEQIATGDVSRLFEHLELALLQVCPSTKGQPDRVQEAEVATLGHPIVSLRDAMWLSTLLQGDDCHFKLHGPPLQFLPGPRAYEVAVATRPSLRKADVSDIIRYMKVQGWGDDTTRRAPHVEIDVEVGTLDPLEYGDSVD